MRQSGIGLKVKNICVLINTEKDITRQLSVDNEICGLNTLKKLEKSDTKTRTIFERSAASMG